MQFVNVLKSPNVTESSYDVIPSILKHTSNVLISLKAAYGEKLKKKSMDSFCKNLVKFKKQYSQRSAKVWIDSGGYHFITGTYGPDDIEKMLAKYCRFSLENFDSFDYIFSLDFPFNKKLPEFSQNFENLYRANRCSLECSLDSFGENDLLSEKFYFVVQFLRDEQHAVWRKLYNDLELGSKIKNRAIGGLVGVRSDKRAVPSPFIGIAYQCLVDFLNAQRHHNLKEFRLHFLGVYLLQDRFEILLLEQICAMLLPGVRVVFTYDSSAYGRKAMLAHLTLPAYIPNNSGGFQYVPRFDDINVNDDVVISDNAELGDLEKIYDVAIIDKVREVLEQSEDKRGAKLKKDLAERINKEKREKEEKEEKESGFLNVFQPFNILSNKCQDEIMQRFIAKWEIAKELTGAMNSSQCKEFADSLMFEMAHCDETDREICSDNVKLSESNLFSDLNLLWSIRRNIILTHEYCQWFAQHRDDEDKLGQMLKEFVVDFNSKSKVW